MSYIVDTMRVCGIEIKGNEAVLALVEAQANELHLVPSPTKRIPLNDDESQESVKLFFDTIGAFFRNNHVQIAAIKKRNKKGEFAGGGVTFKIEGLIQLILDCEVQILSAQTIAASNRKLGFEIPDALNKYQEDAYLTACCAASKIRNG